MQVRNDKNRINKAIELNDIVFIAGIKYSVYDLTEKSIKVRALDEKMPSGFKRNDFINNNTFAKKYFYDKNALVWRNLIIRRMPNLDYM